MQIGLNAEQPLLEEVLFEARQTQKGDRHPERCLKIWRSPSLFAYFSSLREREVLTWDRPKKGAVPEIPGQKFTFDSSNDLNMAITMINAWDLTP